MKRKDSGGFNIYEIQVQRKENTDKTSKKKNLFRLHFVGIEGV